MLFTQGGGTNEASADYDLGSVAEWAVRLCRNPSPETGTGEIKVAQQGLDLLMDGDIDAAIKVFHAIRADHPESPLGDLLEADAIWWKIYLTTGNLVDPDVFEVGPNSASA